MIHWIICSSAQPVETLQAALSFSTKLCTSFLSLELSEVRFLAAARTWVEAAPVSVAARLTSLMAVATFWVPWAACWAEAAISPMAAPCSSTALAMAMAISAIWSMMREMSLMAPTLSAVAVWAASALTSWATTAKPRPASPARSASMVALRARSLV